MKRPLIIAAILLISLSCIFAKPSIKHNPWELIIYRPIDTEKMNMVKCYLKIEDFEGNDVTYSAVKATYELVEDKDKIHPYEKTYYLLGGMAMHLNIKKGRYKITVFTPADKQYPFNDERKITWTSNEFIYDTENPAKVIFVYPTANDNGFYNGGWVISGKAPEFFKVTKPKMKKQK